MSLEDTIEEVSIRTRTAMDEEGRQVASIQVRLEQGVRTEELLDEIMTDVVDALPYRPQTLSFEDAPNHYHGEFYISPLPDDCAEVVRLILDRASEYWAS